MKLLVILFLYKLYAHISIFVMISFYILSKRFSLKRKKNSDARVISITEKEYGFSVHFL